MVEWNVLRGDVREMLRGMESGSVNTVVTSPPYMALRSYLPSDHPEKEKEVGQVADPEVYVADMVEIFREVRRVLRDDGTVWLNIGDCYAGSSKGAGHGTIQAHAKAWSEEQAENVPATGTFKSLGIKAKDLLGIPWACAFALRSNYTQPLCVKSEIDRAWLAAVIDGEGSIGIRRFDSYREDVKQVYQDGFAVSLSVTNTSIELLDRCVEVTGYGKTILSQKAGSGDKRGIVNRLDCHRWRLDANKALDAIRAAYPYLVIKRKQACLAHTLDLLNKNGHGSRAVPKEVQRKKELLYELMKRCNQREQVDLPSWVEEPKQVVEPGWYLRSDIIWHKPNPIPESVRDRPTSAHEHIFLLSKSQKYHYDYAAVKTPLKEPEAKGIKFGGEKYGADSGVGNHKNSRLLYDATQYEGANLRNVWSIPTRSYKGIHFATYPQELIEPCIKAGCPEGGTVLDIFHGSGTTGVVALRLGRNYVGIELHEGHAEQSIHRMVDDAPLFNAPRDAAGNLYLPY